MQYLLTFLITGLLCIIAQLLLANTKIGFLRLLILVICAGVMLTFLGVMSHFEEYVTVSIMTAGQVIFYGMRDLLLNGNPTTLLGFIIMITCILICSVIVGVLKKIKEERD